MALSSSAGESVASRVSRKSPSRTRPPVTDVAEKPLEKTVGALGAGDAPVEASAPPPASEEPTVDEPAAELPGLLEAPYGDGSDESPERRQLGLNGALRQPS